MSVYVDEASIPYGRMKMSHLMADTTEELRAMAKQLGLERHIQKEGEPSEHLDVSLSKRAEAIRLGAVPVGYRELVGLIRSKRAAAGWVVVDVGAKR